MDERTVARFMGKVNKDGPVPPKRPELGPCWLWKPNGSVGGYGQFYIEGRPQLAHRASYKLLVGPIEAGLTIDHLCFVRNCVRPSHLDPVPLGTNLRRSETWKNATGGAFNRAKTHCPQGHPYSGDNLAVRPNGKRVCKACAREQQARVRERRRAENPPVPKPPREFCAHGHSLAEHGVTRGGRQACGECEREKLRRSRARRKALEGPKPVRESCANGHPWTTENTYVSKRGQRHCRTCHNERSAERYAALRAKREAVPPRLPRETCSNGHPWSGDNLYITPDGTEKCRQCAHERNVRYRDRQKAARPAVAPKPPRTHCKHGHELAGDNLYIGPDGRKFCRQCTAMYQARRRAGIAVKSPAKGRRPKDRCPQGHEMTPENTYTSPDGHNKCRECMRKRSREYMRAKYAEGKAPPEDAAA